MVHPTTPPESIAFARYIAWLDARDPFTESGPVALAIAATLPGLDKTGSLLAIREVGESERKQEKEERGFRHPFILVSQSVMSNEAPAKGPLRFF